jgi:hypothetical protein
VRKIAIGLLLMLGFCRVANAQGSGEFGAIEGLVYDAADLSPIEGATVELDWIPATTTTDAAGRYRLPEVPTGVYTVMACKQDYCAMWSDWGTRAVVSAGATAHVDIPLIPPELGPYGLLEAVVLDGDTPAPPGFPFDAAPVPGATVSCSGAAGVTDEQGHCWVLVPAGTVSSIAVTAPGFGTHTHLGVVIHDRGLTSVKLVLTRQTAGIFGRVSDLSTQAPVAGATITITKYEQPWDGVSLGRDAGVLDTLETVRTLADGTYRVTDLPLDTYTVACTVPLGYRTWVPVQVSLTQVGEARRVDFPAEPTRYGAITGRVIDATTGARIANAVIVAGAVQTLSEADGSFLLEQVVAGTTTVSARATGHWWSVVPGVVVREGRTENLDFALSPQPASGPHFGPAVALPSSTGLAWGDYDGDGYADLYLPATEGWYESGVLVGGPQTLLHNNRDGTFTDVTVEAGISREHLDHGGAAWGDYDNDGRLDLFHSGHSGNYPDFAHLYHNDGGGRFSDVTESAGLSESRYGQTVAWCDYDGDSWLDLTIGQAGDGAITIYHNNGDGTFTSVGRSIGMVAPPQCGSGFSCSSIAWGDCNGDGWPDAVGGGGSEGAVVQPVMFTNVGGLGFVAGTSIFNPVQSRANAVVTLADFDNDGRLDCLIQNADLSALMKNGAAGSWGEAFGDVAASVGLSGFAAWGASGAWADYDNDGYVDLFQAGIWGPSLLDHNNAGTSFTEVAAAEGLAGLSVSAVVSWADVDRDGRIDLAISGRAESSTHDTATSSLFPNVGATGNWLRVRALTSATGDATDPGLPTRDAIGARVEVNVHNEGDFPDVFSRSAPVLTRLIDGGSGWRSQSEPVAQFGLPADGPVAVRVTFPDGSVVIHRNVALNQEVEVRDVPADRYQLFSDVELDSWAAPFIQASFEASIVRGYPDGHYDPLGQVTRDQMAVYIARALAGGEANVPTSPATVSFTDVAADHWAYRYIEYVHASGIVTGYPGGTYQPANPVDRGQMAVYVARSIATPTGEAGVPELPAGATPTFADVTGENEWAWCYRHVEYCAAQGVVQGYWDGTYRPAVVVTRDQMAVYIARAFDLL